LSTKFIILNFCFVLSGQIKKIVIMKKDLHPTTQKVKFICSCGSVFEINSSIKDKEVRMEVCSKCHPFYTGEKRILKTGAVDKFYARQKKMEELAKKSKKK